MKKSSKVILLVFLVLFVDQVLKIWIKTHMWIGEEIEILGLDWARIHFVENNGMAFGLSFGGPYGKLILSLFRVIAIGFLIYLIRSFIKADVKWGVLVGFALILAGAIGNMLDSAFYGLLFSESAPHPGGVARFLPAEGGYAGFLFGKVVDMFYFPMFRGYWPDGLPFIGGRPYRFFKPVFNVADMAITFGVLNILIFQRSFFFHEQGAEETTIDNAPSESEETTEEE
ncbi:MAG: lipoprotein signal peptidase [Bacteroidota bacterium]